MHDARAAWATHPDLGPAAKSPAANTDPATEARIDALMQKMTIEQKVGQLIQGDISTITPKDLETWPLGSILAGGNSGPNGNERSSAADWRSEEQTSELQSLMRTSYAVFCLKKKHNIQLDVHT